MSFSKFLYVSRPLLPCKMSSSSLSPPIEISSPSWVRASLIPNSRKALAKLVAFDAVTSWKVGRRHVRQRSWNRSIFTDDVRKAQLIRPYAVRRCWGFIRPYAVRRCWGFIRPSGILTAHSRVPVMNWWTLIEVPSAGVITALVTKLVPRAAFQFHFHAFKFQWNCNDYSQMQIKCHAVPLVKVNFDHAYFKKFSNQYHDWQWCGETHLAYQKHVSHHVFVQSK